MLSKVAILALAVSLCAASAPTITVDHSTWTEAASESVTTSNALVGRGCTGPTNCVDGGATPVTSNDGNAHGGGCTGPSNCVAGDATPVTSNDGNAHGGGGCTGPSNCVAGGATAVTSNDGNAHGVVATTVSSGTLAGSAAATSSNDGNAHGGGDTSTGGIGPTALVDVYMIGAVVLAGAGAGALL